MRVLLKTNRASQSLCDRRLRKGRPLGLVDFSLRRGRQAGLVVVILARGRWWQQADVAVDHHALAVGRQGFDVLPRVVAAVAEGRVQPKSNAPIARVAAQNDGGVR